MIDFKDLSALIDLCITKGVQSVSIPDGVTLSFHPGAKPQEEPKGVPDGNPMVCACGHPKFQHRDGACLLSVDCSCGG